MSKYNNPEFIAFWVRTLSLDKSALEEFGPLDRFSLDQSMTLCKMHGYPPLVGDPGGERVSGAMICETCGQTYLKHPLDYRVIGHGNVPFLNVLCDGRRVKL